MSYPVSLDKWLRNTVGEEVGGGGVRRTFNRRNGKGESQWTR